MFAETCRKIESEKTISNFDIFNDFNLLEGHPWEAMLNSEITNYYSCLLKICKREKPKRILEIGTAFGLSAASMLKASPDIELFITIDLGIYGEQLGFSQNNIEYARSRVHQWCCKKHIPLDKARFYRANSQPERIGDNENIGAEICKWYQIPDLVRLLTQYEFDIIFVDGKHTDDGLFNDFVSFWPMLKEGGLLVCDDLHDEATYKNIFSWAGQTLESFNKFLKLMQDEIEDSWIWNYPRVTPNNYTGLRPFGLIRKSKRDINSQPEKGFEVFDTSEAHEINQARQDHLASLGLDLARKTVLEVGSGIGKHTEFFEKLGCTVLSTDARPENVAEHLRRYPYRKGRVEVADLMVPGSHKKFGLFDIVYCYGTLYHLSDPELCLRELADNCKGLFLLETCVNSYDNNDINHLPEETIWKNQSFDGTGCRPARDWIVSELKKNYPFVYYTRTQPFHGDFPITWPAEERKFINTRAVFVASRIQLTFGTLSNELLDNQKNPGRLLSSGRGLKKIDEGIFYRFKFMINGILGKFNRRKPIVLYDWKGIDLVNFLESATYGEGSKEDLIHEQENAILFKPITRNDHLATPMLDFTIAKGTKNTEIWIVVSFFKNYSPGKNCIFYLQDHTYNRISTPIDFARISYSPGNCNFIRELIHLPINISKARMMITTTDGKPTYIPYSIRIEYSKPLL